MRTFVSVNLDNSTLIILADIQNKLKERISFLNPKYLKFIKWEDKNKFHVTLFFIGETDVNKVNEAEQALTSMQSRSSRQEIKFELKGINAFPDLKYPRVLILELINEDRIIFDLYQNIINSFKTIGLISGKSFHPHITLGRIRRDKKLNLSGLNTDILNGINFSAGKFFLMESRLKSNGSEYSVIKSYNV